MRVNEILMDAHTNREPCDNCGYGDEYCANCDYIKSLNDSYNRVVRVRGWFSELERIEAPNLDEDIEELPF